VPELPDVELYLAALGPRIVGQTLERVRLATPFLLRSVDPPLDSVSGKTIVGLRRLGKRIVWQFDDISSAGELFLVFHLMIAGRFRWRDRDAVIPKKIGLAAFDFPQGTLMMTEAATRKRASLHVVRGEADLARHHAAGLEVMAAGADDFANALRKESHTLKRALTDPHLFSGIGNAYSDEILHRAKLSPFKLTRQLDDDEIRVLHAATRDTLAEWTTRLQAEAKGEFPEKVTAFHDGMAVHGRFGQPCPRCGTPVQRIVHGEHEANYCPTCQTEGRLLADRALSKLLKDDWPKTLDELERRRERLAIHLEDGYSEERRRVARGAHSGAVSGAAKARHRAGWRKPAK
jgi:formamidopyrimidine-DNA glycosylase